MPIITGIVASAKREGRFDLLVDARPRATLGLEAIERLGLTVGREITPALDAAIEREVQALGTLDRALNMLALRGRSTRELRRQLVRKGEPPDLVEAALEKLARMGVLDDGQFARQLARSRLTGGMSKRRVQTELFKKGVERVVADEAIAEVLETEEIDQSESLERVAAKKLRALTKLDPQTQRRRLYAFLARRGYDADEIARTVSALGRASGTEGESSGA